MNKQQIEVIEMLRRTCRKSTEEEACAGCSYKEVCESLLEMKATGVTCTECNKGSVRWNQDLGVLECTNCGREGSGQKSAEEKPKPSAGEEKICPARLIAMKGNVRESNCMKDSCEIYHHTDAGVGLCSIKALTGALECISIVFEKAAKDTLSNTIE